MSAEAIDSWRVTLPCTRAEAEAIDAAFSAAARPCASSAGVGGAQIG